MIKKLLIILILAAICYGGYKVINHTLINSTLQMDLKDTDYISHSLMDEQAKKEMLLLYTDTNDQLYRLARNSSSYFSYELEKARILAGQDKKRAAIMSAYHQRKHTKHK